MAYIPMFDVRAAVAELRFAERRRLRGAVIPAYAPPEGYTGGAFNLSNSLMYAEPDGPRGYADPEFEPFWRAAVELGTPLHVHLGAARFRDRRGPDSRFSNQMRTKLAMAEVVVHFVMSGVLPDHPELKLVSVESGVGWLAFAAEYLDNTWRKHRYSTASPIRELPSTYFDRQVYATFLEDRAGVNNRHLKGAGNIMWSSDYPHSETSWPNSQEAIRRSFADVPPAEREQLTAGIARRLYGLA
jgi:predicted TIM-barrel fold metal-dependent hydrolase